MLKQIEGSWNAWDIFTGLDPRLSHVPKSLPYQRNIAELSAFFKGQHELKTLNPSEFYRTVDLDFSYGYLRSHEHNKSRFSPYLPATRSQDKQIWRQMKTSYPPRRKALWFMCK